LAPGNRQAIPIIAIPFSNSAAEKPESVFSALGSGCAIFGIFSEISLCLTGVSPLK
jgi:hypothetical protein